MDPCFLKPAKKGSPGKLGFHLNPIRKVAYNHLLIYDGLSRSQFLPSLQGERITVFELQVMGITETSLKSFHHLWNHEIIYGPVCLDALNSNFVLGISLSKKNLSWRVRIRTFLKPRKYSLMLPLSQWKMKA